MAEPKGRTRRRVEVRREEILGVALAEIERVGPAAVRVSDVAAELGVSTGLVFYHFGTKDQLVADAFGYAVERDLAQMRRAAERAGSVPDRVRAVLRTYGPTGGAAGWRLWVDAWSLAQREPVIAAELRRLDEECRSMLRTVVGEGVAEGSVTCADPDAAVTRLFALLDGLSVAAEVQRSVTRAQLRTWVEQALVAELGLADAAGSPGEE